MKAEAPYLEAASAPAKTRRRKHLKAYNVLGDVEEYESMLQAVQPRVPTPEPPAVFDVSNVPAEVMEAMQMEQCLYQPILEAFHQLVAEQLELKKEYVRVSASQEQAAQSFQQQSLTRSADTRDSRTLAKHKEYEEAWAIQAVHVASKVGKKPEDVVLSRAFKFRKRREKLDHLHKSKPVYERLPGHLYWQVSLRDCHSRFVQVGNEFNGLFTEAKEKPPELLDIPLEIFGKPRALDPSRGKTASLLIESLGLRRRRLLRTDEEKGRAWLQGEYLAQTLLRYKKAMARVMSHTPETDQLVVFGNSEAEALKQRSEAPLTLEHVVARLAQCNPEAHARYEEAAAVRKQQELEKATAALQEAEEALQLQQEQSGPLGPAARLSATRLVLTATVGFTSFATLTVRSVGTAALRYHWTRSVQRTPLAAVSGNRDGSGLGAQCGFYMYNMSGCIMPGEEKQFQFMWKPSRQSMETEVWQLHTSPNMPPGFESPQVVLRGVGVKHDSDSLLRGRVEQNLVQSISRREATAALERILRDLHAHVKQEKIPEQWVKDHDQFAAAGAAGVPVVSAQALSSGSCRPLFWTEGLGARVLAAYDQLKDAVTPVRQETPPGTKAKKPKDNTVAQEDELLTEVYAWDGSIQELLSLSEQVHERETESELRTKAAAIVAEVKAVIAAADLPHLRAVIVSHALRSIAVRAAAALEHGAASASAAAEASFAERQAAEGVVAEEEPKKDKQEKQKGAKGKGKGVEQVEPEKPKYDVAELHSLLEAEFRQALKKSLNDVEPVMEGTLELAGQVLDGKIRKVQAQLKAATAKGDSGAEEQKAWELFSWLRKHERFGIRQQPADLLVKAAPVRADPLDFGHKFVIHQPKPAATMCESQDPAPVGEEEPALVEEELSLVDKEQAIVEEGVEESAAADDDAQDDSVGC